jgi:glutathione synthase/RimK-type ligase-like ATP-grasp enzyme
VDIALVTCSRLPDLTEDDRLLRDALVARGARVEATVWDAPGVVWTSFDRVVLRSVWDYHERVGDFLAWVDRLEGLRVPLWNPPATVRANSHKSYLADLGARGVPVVPMIELPRGATLDLGRLLEGWDWADAVVKPAVSASAYRTWRVSPATAPERQAELDRMLRDGDVLVQPYVPEITSAGEWSFVFFAGEYSHAVRKVPKAGDYRVQSELGGRVIVEEPTAALRRDAERIAAGIPRPWLYARVDAVERHGVLTLMELELIEPVLFLGEDARAPTRFADAILHA